MEGVFLSINEVILHRIIDDFRSGKLSRYEAALKLSISERQVSRVAKKIRQQGLTGVAHGNRKRKPYNVSPAEVQQWYVNTYRLKYENFNFRHAMEMMALHEVAPLAVCYSTFRMWCRAAGLGKVRRRRASKARISRERSAQEGFMLQMDGSPHVWFGKEKSCLITMIDDATSDIPAASFFESETTWGCFTVLQEVILAYGIPEVILTDEAGWSTGGTKRESFSQFARACEELDIKLIGTPSAESKGRVERSNRTNQDRLIPELELYGITAMKDANRYLKQVYLPHWRESLTVQPVSADKRYKKVPPTIDIKEVLCYKFKRIVNRGHQVSFDNQAYTLKPGTLGNLWKKQIMIHQYQDESFAFFYNERKIDYTRVKPQLKNWKRNA
ncbi:MAG: ISNCY family transposase [Proteobacteria bacterium]|nr:ISNCY family transposase [Pseudomonadota bacterium]